MLPIAFPRVNTMNDNVHDAKKNWAMVKIHPIIGETRLVMVGVVGGWGRAAVGWPGLPRYSLVNLFLAR